MGRVLVEITVENLEDAWAVRRGLTRPEEARRITIPDALVGTGATILSLPTRYIQELGLRRVAAKRVLSSAGPREAWLYEAVWLTILDRFCTVDVLELPDGGIRSRGD